MPTVTQSDVDDFGSFLESADPTPKKDGDVENFGAFLDTVDPVAPKAPEPSIEYPEFSINTASGIPPEVASKTLKLSSWSGFDPSFVQRNMEPLTQEKAKADVDFELVKRSTPVTAQWMGENEYHSALTLDDIHALMEVEKGVQDYGMLHNSMKAFFKTGMLNAGNMVLRSPGGQIESALGSERVKQFVPNFGTPALPVGLIETVTGSKLRAPQFLLDNPATQYLEKKAQETSTWELNESFADELKRGNVSRAGRILAVQAMAQLPNTALIGLMGAVGGMTGASAGLAMMGAGEAGTSSVEAENKGIDTGTGQVGAMLRGGAEVGGEYLGSILPFQQWGEAITRTYGKEMTKRVFLDMFKTLVFTHAEEGLGEGATQVSQDLTDYFTGVNPDALKGIGERAFNATAIGTAIGVPTNVASVAYTMRQNINDRKHAVLARDFYMALGDTVEKTKLKERMPEKMGELVDRITKDGPVENLFLNPDVIDKKFQSSKDGPIPFLQEVGALEAYETAKAEGGPVKIPLSKWAEKVVGTEWYPAFKDDVKFSSDGSSFNEAVEFFDKVKKEAEEAKGVSDEHQASVEKIYNDYASKLSRLKTMGKKEVDANAKLFSEMMARRALTHGIDPYELYQKELPVYVTSPIIRQSREGMVKGLARGLRDEAIAQFRREREIFDAIKEAVGGRGLKKPDMKGEYDLLPQWMKGGDNVVASQWDEVRLELVDKGILKEDEDFWSFMKGVTTPTPPLTGLASYYDMAEKQIKAMEESGNLEAYEAREAGIPDGAVGGDSMFQSNEPVFIGWQEPFGDIAGFPLYNMPSESGGMTTVGADTLKAKGYEVPKTPTLEEWQSTGPLYQSRKEMGLPEYAGDHRPPDMENGAPSFDLAGKEGIYPEDIYGPNGAKYYGHGDSSIDNETISILKYLRGHPTRSVSVYRAVPNNLTVSDKLKILEKQKKAYMARHTIPNGEKIEGFYDRITNEIETLKSTPIEEKKIKINAGDWVTVNRTYAKEHGESALNGKYKILKKTVQARELFTNGDSIHEFGYWPYQEPTFQESSYRPSVVSWAKSKFGDKVAPDGSTVWKNFVEWFGDSKVVDADGKPMVVYHGTTNDFTEFSKDKAAMGGITWFASGPSEASDFAGTRDGANVKPLFVSLQNPAGWDEYENLGLGQLKSAGYDGVILKDNDGSFSGFVFEPKALKSATGNVGTFGKENPSILYQSSNSPVWYSQLQKTIEEKLPNMAPVSMVKNIIDPAKGGAKAEEVEWSGINEFLAGKDKVSKAALLDFLKQNEVEVKEVVKGGTPSMPGGKETQARGLAERDGHIWDNLPTSMQRAFMERAGKGEVRDDTKFTNYQLPGGSNYREVLLTLPPQKNAGYVNSERYDLSRLTEAEKLRWGVLAGVAGDGNLYESERDEWEALQRKTKPLSSDFRSSHFDEPNIIAHVRMNDRTTADGKRVLFLEEVQSDWHQKGREEGYAGVQESGTRGGVPNAPFKKTWHEMALKRMLRWAVDNGYDGLAWTTGEQQADRYDLSKQVESIYAAHSAKGIVYLEIKDKNGGEVSLPNSHVKKEDLPELLGKDLAEKISQDIGLGKGQKNKETYTGVDLKVGGEGMKGFYDQIIPSFLNKYTKKWGGRVGETEIPTKLENKKSGYVIEENDGQYEVREKDTDTLIDSFDYKNEAEDYLQTLKEDSGVKEHYLEITPAMRESVARGQALFQTGPKDPRASVTRTPDYIRIDLLAKADVSSFLHEMAHVWAGYMAKDYSYFKGLHELNAMQKQFVKDAETVLQYVGAESFETMTTDQHEIFARSFEAYMREGKAPSVELQSVFQRFKEWLLSIYRAIRELDVELTDEVRGVFDRMLATDEQIAEARQTAGFKPLFGDWTSFGMSAETAQAFSESFHEAEMEAERLMMAKMADTLRKEESKEWKAKRDAVEKEVSREIMNQKEYVALSILQRGTFPDGTPAPEALKGLKLSGKELKERFSWNLDELPRPFIYAKEGGTPLDEVAMLFGFASGDNLAMTMKGLPKMADAIKVETDRRMQERYGEKKTAGEMAETAMVAIHNQKRDELLKREIQYLMSRDFFTFKKLVKRITGTMPPSDVLERQAYEIINKKVVRDIYPAYYLSTEKKANAEAVNLLTKGDVQGAFNAKTKERINHYLYRASVEAKERIDRIVDRMKFFGKLETRKALGKSGASNLAQIDAILDRFSFKTSMTNKRIADLESLASWVNKQREAGYPVSIPDSVLNEANRYSYKVLPYVTMLEISESVEKIYKQAMLKNELLANQKARTIDEAVSDFVATATALHGDGKQAKPEPITQQKFKGVKKFFKRMDASHAKMEFVGDQFDGGEFNGPFYNHIIKPLLEARDNEWERIAKENPILEKIFSVYSKKERAFWNLTKTFVPELGESLTKAEILSIALNLGNEYNMESLMKGDSRFTEESLNGVLNTLTSKDVELLNNIWAYLDTFWPESKALEEEIVGVAPEKVIGRTIVLKNGNGTLNGGYYPIRFDPDKNRKAGDIIEAEHVKDMFGGAFTSPMTKHSHLKARVGNNGGLLLSLSVLTDHVQNVIHDITHRKAIIDVYRLINDDRMAYVLSSVLGDEVYRQMKPWLHAVAGKRQSSDLIWMEQVLRRARTGMTTVSLGLKATSGIMQTAGYGNTVHAIGAKWALYGLQQVALRMKDMPKLVKEITDESKDIKFRLTTYDRDVRDAMSQLAIGAQGSGVSGVVDYYTRGANEAYFSFIGFMDLATSIPTYIGAKEKAMAGEVRGIQKGDEVSAIAYAEKIVRKTQSANSVMDLAGVQRGTEYQKMFSMFYSQLSIQYNRFREVLTTFHRTKEFGPVFSAFVWMVFAQAFMQDMIYPHDDDKKWWERTAKNMVQIPLSTVVGVRDLADAFDGWNYNISPIGQVGKSLAGTVRALSPSSVGGKEDVGRADYKTMFDALGYIAHLPTQQVWKTAEYFYLWLTGEEEASNPATFFWNALVKGKTRD